MAAQHLPSLNTGDFEASYEVGDRLGAYVQQNRATICTQEPTNVTSHIVQEIQDPPTRLFAL